LHRPSFVILSPFYHYLFKLIIKAKIYKNNLCGKKAKKKIDAVKQLCGRLIFRRSFLLAFRRQGAVAKF
jgi:hypothetical protein